MKDTNLHPAPVWLNTEYLQPILCSYKKDQGLTITKLDIKPATAKGDNYCSVMTRISVTFNLSNNKTEYGSYIVKTTHEGDAFTASIMNEYDVYGTEMLMYEQILPKLSELLRQSGDEDKLFADTIYVDYEHSAIIFEDLAVLKFITPDRLLGMDEAQTLMTLKKLAKMHATGAVLNERMPGILTQVQKGLFNHSTRGFATYFEGILDACGDFAEKSPTLGSYYKDKLLKLKPYVMEYGTCATDPQPGDFLTLAHGDMWTNNVMLRYDDGQYEDGKGGKAIRDVMLIDFQYSAWTTPTVDLHYFFHTSVPLERRLLREDEYVQHYHGFLADTLRQLNYGGRIPSLHDFCVQMEVHRFFAVVSSLGCQACLINDKTEDADFKTLMGTDERSRNFRKMLYTNKKTQESAKVYLPYFDRKGLLDVNE